MWVLAYFGVVCFQWQLDFHSPLSCSAYLVLLLFPWDFAGTALQIRKHVSWPGCLVSLGSRGVTLSVPSCCPMSLSRWRDPQAREDREAAWIMLFVAVGSFLPVQLTCQVCLNRPGGSSASRTNTLPGWGHLRDWIPFSCSTNPPQYLWVRRRVLAWKNILTDWTACCIWVSLVGAAYTP